MELSVIQIGNSKGLRLTKSILETYNIKDKVELILEKGQTTVELEKAKSSSEMTKNILKAVPELFKKN